MKYKIIVDNGKPFEIITQNKEGLFNELLKLDNEQAQTDIPFLDITILKIKNIKLLKGCSLGSEEDITDEVFKQYNFKKERIGFLI